MEEVVFKRHRRVIGAIRTKCFKLGLYRDLLFSPHEQEIINKYYPLEGSQVYYRLNTDKFTVDQVRNYAKRVKLKAPTVEWTLEEDDLLRLHYPVIGRLASQYIPEKTQKQVVHRAQFLKLKANTAGTSADKWTEEECNIIKQYYPIEGKECYIRLIDINPGHAKPAAVRDRAHRLNVQGPSTKNSKRQIRCLETNDIFESISKAAIAYGLTNSGASKYFKGARNYWGKLPDGTKLHWEYVEEDETQENNTCGNDKI